MQKIIGQVQTFICNNQNCPTLEFKGAYTKGLMGFAKPPRCPNCNQLSETVLGGIGKLNLAKVKTQGHPKYAERI